MEQPPGYIAKEENKVCHLKKAIDGLKQSPRAWFEKFNITISDIGFHSFHSDHFAFVRHTKSDIVVLAVYVDILLTGSDSAGLLKTKKYFKRHFMTKDMRRHEYFLGIEVVHQKYNTLLSQRKYALDLLKQDSWGASLIALQWKPMWTYGLMTVTHLMIHEDIGD